MKKFNVKDIVKNVNFVVYCNEKINWINSLVHDAHWDKLASLQDKPLKDNRWLIGGLLYLAPQELMG